MIYLPLMLYQSEGIVTYPFTVDDFMALHPEVTLPEVYSVEFFLPYGVQVVATSPRPEYDPAVEKIVEGVPLNGTFGWYQVWNVVPLSVDELAAKYTEAEERAQKEAARYLSGTNIAVTQAFANKVKLHPDYEAYISSLVNVSSLPGYPFAVEWPQTPANIFDGAGLPINAYSKEESDARYVQQ